MTAHHGRQPGDLTSRHGHPSGGGHEKTDISMRAVVFTAAGYVGLGVLGLVVCWFVFFSLRPARLADQRSMRHDRPEAPLPPEPRLQVAPWVDMKAQREYENALLHGYGWTDRPAGRARIPIERAMEIVAEREARAGNADETPEAAQGAPGEGSTSRTRGRRP